MPRVLLNCAVSLDGRVAGPQRPVRLSDDGDMRRVHRMRAEADAILVGVNTVLSDDPSLRVKAQYATGADPLRVVLDADARTPPDARVRPAVIFHGPEARDPEGVPVPCADGRIDLAAVLGALEERGVETLMVEGGPQVLRSFVDTGLWHRFTVYQAPVLLGGGPTLWPGGVRHLRGSVEAAGEGALWTFSPG